jgi:DNA-binding transcriptional LysR family regulator
MLRLDDLQTFSVLAEELHFGRAARRLEIAPSALTQRIKRLEAAVGTPLFDRTTRQVELTPAGRELTRHVARILTLTRVAVARSRRAGRGEGSIAVVGLSPLVPHPVFLSIANAVRSRQPDISLELRRESNEERLVGLLARRWDMSLLWQRADRVVQPGDDNRPANGPAPLRTIEIARARLQAMLPARHRLARRRGVRLSELATEAFVSLGPGSVLREALEDACQAAGFVPGLGQDAADIAALMLLVSSGAGVSLAPAEMRFHGVEGCVFVPIDPPPPELRLIFVRRTDEDDGAAAHVESVIRDLLDQGRLALP